MSWGLGSRLLHKRDVGGDRLFVRGNIMLP